MKTALLAFLFSTTPLLAAEPISASRSAGAYQVTVTLSKSEPRSISSIAIQHRKERYTLPTSLFDDIRVPHIGPGFKATEFRFEVERSKALIRITAGTGTYPDDHSWILPLPLKDARRITRSGDVTGYGETRPSTPLLK